MYKCNEKKITDVNAFVHFNYYLIIFQAYVKISL